MKWDKNNGFTLAELLVVILILLLIALIPAFSLWTGRNLDFWLTHFKGHVVHVPFWLDLLLTIILNGVSVALNVIGEIARFVI